MMKKYIQFAINNGYDKYEEAEICSHKKGFGKLRVCIDSDWDGKIWRVMKNGDIIELITSKPFIEAVAIGVIKKGGEVHNPDIYDIVRYITFEQAIAIRENTLDEFIENLLPNE